MRWAAIVLLGFASWPIYLAIALTSPRFDYDAPFADRPIPRVLALLAVAFAMHLAALAIALRMQPTRWLMAWIVTAAVAFRLTLLPSTPIQEIDIYRYVWDGAVSAAGVSPFRYSPEQVLEAAASDAPKETLPDDLVRLVAMHDGQPALAVILSRVHFPDVPTVYPPVSQAAFALAAWLTPRHATVAGHLLTFKCVFVGFDLLTLWLVIALLRHTRRHAGWSLAYGWCPLVIKEFANSGHLDAIAVCLTTAAAYLVVRGLFEENVSRGTRRVLTASAAMCLSLAVGAKLYPVVLAPLFLFAVMRRDGWREALGAGVLLSACTTSVLWPMLKGQPRPSPSMMTDAAEESAPFPANASEAWTPQNPSRGLRTFLGHWEMNDFLFLVLVENVKPLAETPLAERPWFAVVPEDWRQRPVGPLAARLHIAPKTCAFLLVRVATSMAFVLIALGLAWRAAAEREASRWLKAVFLTLAWFWLLSPTQNPWYWTWAMPFIPFARSRMWLLLSGLALGYYLRFWLGYHWPDTPVPGSSYHGALFFDFVVTWVEFAPWLGGLAIESWPRRAKTSEAADEPIAQRAQRRRGRQCGDPGDENLQNRVPARLPGHGPDAKQRAATDVRRRHGQP